MSGSFKFPQLKLKKYSLMRVQIYGPSEKPNPMIEAKLGKGGHNPKRSNPSMDLKKEELFPSPKVLTEGTAPKRPNLRSRVPTNWNTNLFSRNTPMSGKTGPLKRSLHFKTWRDPIWILRNPQWAVDSCLNINLRKEIRLLRELYSFIPSLHFFLNLGFERYGLMVLETLIHERIDVLKRAIWFRNHGSINMYKETHRRFLYIFRSPPTCHY